MRSAFSGLMDDYEPVPPHPELESDVGYVYHATNIERAHDIARSGLETHKPWAYTDQSSWPDGATEKRNYFSPHARVVYSFAPEEGHPVVLRVRIGNHPVRREGTGDVYSTRRVRPEHLEILTHKGWLPLQDWDMHDEELLRTMSRPR